MQGIPHSFGERKFSPGLDYRIIGGKKTRSKIMCSGINFLTVETKSLTVVKKKEREPSSIKHL